ncbi:unnamed protein product [Ambrosiozyma monospora]|uniref:Unnamed protein product n=1 Tax=Ambrosiozyma monospora TaxID=43982 RepID=A0ACB5TA44_AMBMO|nr:unnamed protein product [Ambrosiozyma monospora]
MSESISNNSTTDVLFKYSPPIMLGLTTLFLINKAIPHIQDFINGKSSLKPVAPVSAAAPRPVARKPKSFEPAVIKPIDDDFDWTKTEPYPFRPFKNKKYTMTMATRRLDPEEFYVLERTYLNRINLKKKILKERPASHIAYFQCTSKQ